MSDQEEPVAARVAVAAARTVAAGTARLFFAWSTDSPVPEARDWRGDGVADLIARRARVSQLLGSARMADFLRRRTTPSACCGSRPK